ncbi:YicC/YloC family endoribonuclease [Virgibacillus sp. W0430]|uniref:YicC/YloC family endoribonuclease n=1 Tax=Virgibacillus sp. W0430 TaxID=3391580 RepID=UPI003F4896CC
MVRSMTGYGFASVSTANTTITVEIRTINNRYLDFSPKIPRTFISMEDKIRKMIQRYFYRGRIEVYIEQEGQRKNQALDTDWDLLEQFMEQAQEIKSRFQLSSEVPLSSILSLPNIMRISEKEAELSTIEPTVLEGVEKACMQVVSARKREGQFLFKDIKKRAAVIKEHVFGLEERRVHVIDEYRERIQQRIEEFTGTTIAIEHSHLLQEIAILAEKGDITEEITRLSSHLNHFWEITEAKEPIGRKLDFILQEMLREANTVGAKSMDPEISASVVVIKSNIEKIKEQIQNIE